MANYENVQVGDKFLVHGRHKSNVVRSVTKVTPKRFEINGYTFNKSDGSQVGGGTWDRTCIEEVTPEVVQRLREQYIKRTKLNAIKAFDYEKLNETDLQTIYDLISKYSEGKKDA